MEAGQVIEVPPPAFERAIDVAALSEHGPMLLATARLITGDEDEAQDLVQATFEIAIRHLGSLQDPTATRAWLLRIETREAFRVARRLRRFVRLDGRLADTASNERALGERAEIGEALRKLPARTRAAVVLHYLADLSVRETATALDVSENTVKTQLKHGLARLREDLGHD
jgi:RNA polymerase sigma-70 factor (ECF subfamily)